MKELFVIVFKDTNEILTPNSFKEYWKNYGSGGSGGLYGWRPPKKIYYNIGQAKSGFAFIPDKLKSKLKISRFERVEDLEDGGELKVKQKEKRKKREKAKKKRFLEYQKEAAERAIRAAKEELEKLQKES